MKRTWRQYVQCSARFVSLSPPHVISRLLRNLTFQVLVAVSLGILLGVVAPDTAKSLKPLGDTFINLVKMVITPIIFLTIVHGIASMADLRKLGRVGGNGHSGMAEQRCAHTQHPRRGGKG